MKRQVIITRSTVETAYPYNRIYFKVAKLERNGPMQAPTSEANDNTWTATSGETLVWLKTLFATIGMTETPDE